MNQAKIDELLKQTARVEGFNQRVFSVGPFGARVGFAFQQARALNLSGALVEHILAKKENPAKIAVIGAGLAGLTSYAALCGQGCPNVTLFESAHDILTTQSDAEHRLVHPSYNRWPLEDYFSSATDFPFLNWHAGSASEVVAAISTSWNTLLKPYCPAIKFHHALKGIEYNKTDDKVVLTIEKTTKKGNIKLSDHEFDYVVFATGFGIEKDLSHSHTQSYWLPYDHLSKARFNRRNTSFLISGSGDGAVIECLRLAFKHNKLNTVMMQVIASLRAQQYQTRLSASRLDGYEVSTREDQIRQKEDEIAALDKPKIASANDEKNAENAELRNQNATQLEAFYRNLVKALPSGVIDIIEENIDKEFYNVPKIRLISSLKAPFRHNTAPINKLLLAYLMEKHKLQYDQARIDLSLEVPAVNFNEKPNQPLAEYSCVVLRHGSTTPISTLLPDFGLNAARELSELADWTETEYDPARFTKHFESFLSADPNTLKYKDRRSELLRSFKKKFYGHQVDFELETISKDGVREQVCKFFPTNDNTSKIDSSYKETGGFDSQLFGVKISHNDLEELDPHSKLQQAVDGESS